MVYPPTTPQYCVSTNYQQYSQVFYNSGAKLNPYYNQSFIRTSNNNYTSTSNVPSSRTGRSKSTEKLSDISNNYHDKPCLEVKSKTELCKNFVDGIYCPFGSRCKFAHGYHELKQRSLMDMKRQGLVDDIYSYRTRPCFTWISTGSCPFNSRCKCLHDPRAKGCRKYWLPHVRMPESLLPTDVNVDNRHHLEMEEIHSGSPFGSIIPSKKYERVNDAWSNLYDTICNIEERSMFNSSLMNYANKISESHRISIAIEMYHKKGDLFTYQPSHLLFGELCMVIQTRTFRILDFKGNSDVVIEEVNSNEVGYYQQGRRRSNTVTTIVREIAFGSAGDPSVRKAGLWFDIPDRHLTKCSPKQAKQIQKKINRMKSYDIEESITRNSELEFFIKQKNPPFHVFYTSNNDAYDLIQNILTHRGSVLKSSRNNLNNMSLENMYNYHLKAKELQLKVSFEKLIKHFDSWVWPINEGREKLNAKNKEFGVPSNDTNYHFSQENKAKFSQTTSHIWNSTIDYLENCDHNESINSRSSILEKSKLKVFQELREMEHSQIIATNG